MHWQNARMPCFKSDTSNRKMNIQKKRSTVQRKSLRSAILYWHKLTCAQQARGNKFREAKLGYDTRTGLWPLTFEYICRLSVTCVSPVNRHMWLCCHENVGSTYQWLWSLTPWNTHWSPVPGLVPSSVISYLSLAFAARGNIGSFLFNSLEQLSQPIISSIES